MRLWLTLSLASVFLLCLMVVLTLIFCQFVVSTVVKLLECLPKAQFAEIVVQMPFFLLHPIA